MLDKSIYLNFWCESSSQSVKRGSNGNTEQSETALDAEGYTWDANVYDSADYGAATSRRRLIVRAVKYGELPQLPQKIEQKTGWYEVVEDLVDDLPTTELAQWQKERLEADGIDINAIEEPLFVFDGGGKNGKARYAFASSPLPTITASGSADRIVMPGGEVKLVSPRVLARIMGLPDSYKLPEGRTLAHTVLGNGVPVKLTEAVIAPMLEQFQEEKTDSMEGQVMFSSRWYGGNSGYVGYSMSKRAAKAREEGRFPKTDFKKEYGVTDNALKFLVDAKIIDDSEWHHTSKYGNKTTFYSWNGEGYADYYANNKTEIDKVAREIVKSKPEMESFEPTESGMKTWEGQYNVWKQHRDEIVSKLWDEFEAAEEEWQEKERIRTEAAQKEWALRVKYETFIRDLNVPEEYAASNGVRVETNGSGNSYLWKYYYGENPAFKKYAVAAKEELERRINESKGDVPTFEEWKALNGENEVRLSAKEANERFNQELQQQIDGTLPVGHIYQLGMPGEILRASGFPLVPIELSATRLAEKAAQENHIFDISEVKDLVRELNNPLAVFRYGNNAKNVIVGIEHNGKQFLVGVHFNQSHRGMEVSDIRGIFPKDNAEWLNWITQGKANYLDKEKIQTLIDKQRINLAEVEYLDLDSVANIIETFANPQISEEENLGEQANLTSEDSDTRMKVENQWQDMLTEKEREAMQAEHDAVYKGGYMFSNETAFDNGTNSDEGVMFRIEDELNFKAKYNLIGAGVTAVIESEEDLLKLKNIIDDDVYAALENAYNNPYMYGGAYPQHTIIAIYKNKPTAPYPGLVLWHEQAHIAYNRMNLADKEECGLVALEWLKNQTWEGCRHYDIIINNYKQENWPNEATARLIEYTIEKYGVDRFLSSEFGGNKKLSKLVTAIKNQLVYGKEEPTERDILRRTEYLQRAQEADSRRDRKSNGPNRNRPYIQGQSESERGRSREVAQRNGEGYQDNIVEREGEGAVSDYDVTMASDPVSKVIGEPRYGRGKKMREYAALERKHMARKAKEIAEKLNLDNVEIVTDASALEGRRAKAKGFYNVKTDKITIVVPNHTNVFDVAETVLYEAVAHYGLR